ncbi:MAG: group III truncated hemoglobin [Lysobacteraceae bacterium]|nr:MAG: group III truncated hemoglobin [Xanthomonadaceae bacterium]
MNAPGLVPPGPGLCTEEEVTRLVHGFYARVRLDPGLGPIFEQHVADWPAHLALLVDFWSAMLRGTRRFRGAPMSRHLALPGLSQELFSQWLHLFRQVTATLGNPAMQAQADDMAERIADTFWQRYRLHSSPPPLPMSGAHDDD